MDPSIPSHVYPTYDSAKSVDPSASHYTSSLSLSTKTSHCSISQSTHPQPTYIDSVVISCLSGAIEIFVDTLSSASPSKMEKFSFLWSTFNDDIEMCVRRSMLHQSTISLVAHVSERVEVLAKSAADLEYKNLNLVQACCDLQAISGQVHYPASSLCHDTNTSLYEPWRSWFLEHLSWPYPVAHERGFLLGQVPHLTDKQLTTWFKNARRRSGWTRLFHVCCRSDRAMLSAVITSLEQKRNCERIHPETAQIYNGIDRYLRQAALTYGSSSRTQNLGNTDDVYGNCLSDQGELYRQFGMLRWIVQSLECPLLNGE